MSHCVVRWWNSVSSIVDFFHCIKTLVFFCNALDVPTATRPRLGAADSDFVYGIPAKKQIGFGSAFSQRSMQFRSEQFVFAAKTYPTIAKFEKRRLVLETRSKSEQYTRIGFDFSFMAHTFSQTSLR